MGLFLLLNHLLELTRMLTDYQFLFVNIYPHIVAGSEIRVPEKLPRKPSTGVGALTGVFTGVATLVLAITQLNL